MKKKNSTAYPIIIEWSEEDACFVAHTPAIKYGTAHGDTYEEAAREQTKQGQVAEIDICFPSPAVRSPQHATTSRHISRQVCANSVLS